MSNPVIFFTSGYSEACLEPSHTCMIKKLLQSFFFGNATQTAVEAALQCAPGKNCSKSKEEQPSTWKSCIQHQ